jgi:hypothetical protein
MRRRDFLKVSGGLPAQIMAGGSLLSIRQAEADTGLPIAALKAALDPKKDMVLIPETSRQYDISFSKRTQLTPRVRVVAASAARSARRSCGPPTMELVLPSARAVTPMRDFRRARSGRRCPWHEGDQALGRQEVGGDRLRFVSGFGL